MKLDHSNFKLEYDLRVGRFYDTNETIVGFT